MTDGLSKEDFYQAIGRVVVEFGYLEHWIRRCISAVLPLDLVMQTRDRDELGRIFVSGQDIGRNIETLCRLLRNLYKEDEATLARIDAWRAAVREVQKDRNELLHAIWIFHEDEQRLVHIRETRSGSFVERYESNPRLVLEEAEAIVDLTKSVTSQINALVQEHCLAIRKRQANER